MALTFRQRKTVEVNWSTETIKGLHASIEVYSDALQQNMEIRNVENDGHATVTFPASFVGPAELIVSGSHGGEDSGTVEVD